MISVHFQGKAFNITVIKAIKIYAPASNTEEAETEWFYEDLQDLLELTPKKDVERLRSNPTSKERQLHGCRRAKRSYSTFKVRRGGREIPLIQGKEQQLCFAGAAVKRYPTSEVRETQVRR